jgi:hypothetical protein
MDSMYEFNQTGFPGCIDSSDATQIIHGQCHSRLKNHHLGANSSMATTAFNNVMSHRRKILNTTVGLPGKWNDKTVVLFEGMISGMQNGTLCTHFEFKLEDEALNKILFKGSRKLFVASLVVKTF